MDKHVEILRRNAQPMQPIATEVTPRLDELHGIRAVMFDVYGTLFISASGDVGTVAVAPAEAFANACRAVGLELKVSGDQGAATFVETIKASHAEAHRRGVEHPEVDIVAIWEQTIAQLTDRQAIVGDVGVVDFSNIAVEYEARVNPVWPMPGLEACLAALQRTDLQIGIVSNAQFFTPLLFPAFVNKTVAEAGFRPELCLWSYQFGRAKPGLFLFERARESLARLGIAAGEVLYIGNDMLNDVMPAQQIGFRTALFAGDARSLRMRETDTRVEGVEPVLVLTHLDQIAPTLGGINLAEEQR